MEDVFSMQKEEDRTSKVSAVLGRRRIVGAKWHISSTARSPAPFLPLHDANEGRHRGTGERVAADG